MRGIDKPYGEPTEDEAKSVGLSSQTIARRGGCLCGDGAASLLGHDRLLIGFRASSRFR